MRYRNDRYKPKQKDCKILDRCFVSLGAPPPKKAKQLGEAVNEDDESGNEEDEQDTD